MPFLVPLKKIMNIKAFVNVDRLLNALIAKLRSP